MPSERASALARRRARFSPALGLALFETRGQPAPPEIQTVRTWFDNWTGLGHIVTGMQRQDYDVELTRYDGRGWRATFYVTGMEHSLTNDTGTAWEPTPWPCRSPLCVSLACPSGVPLG